MDFLQPGLVLGLNRRKTLKNDTCLTPQALVCEVCHINSGNSWQDTLCFNVWV